MTTATKAQILDRLAKVSDKTFVGYAIQLFCRNAHLKTDAELTQMVLNLRDQAKDNWRLLKKCLGSQYKFLMTVVL